MYKYSLYRRAAWYGELSGPVEVDASRGLPGFEMVGLLGSEVKEARERIRVALKCGDGAAPVRITVNISPGQPPQGRGTSYDLPVAVGILVSTGMIPRIT